MAAVVPDQTAWYPQDHGHLIDNAVKEQSVAGRVLTSIATDGNTIGFPVLDSDPDVSWYAPGAEIAETNAGTSELIVTPKAVKGLVRVSNEALRDSAPENATVFGQGLARQITEQVDAALFATSTLSNAPEGIEASTVSEIGADLLAVSDEDPFVEAKFVAIENGAQLSAFVLSTDVAKALAAVKVASGDARRLLAHDEQGNLSIAGLPAYVSRHVAGGTAYGLDRTQNYLVVRAGTSVERDTSAAFSADSTLVRAVARVAFAVTNPAGVVRIAPAAA